MGPALAALAMLFAPGVAVADDPPPEGGTASEAADASGTGAAGGSTAAANAAEAPEAGIEVDAILPTSHHAHRFWQVEGLFETHYNLVSDEHSGVDWTSDVLLRGKLNLTERDQIAVRMDLEQRYVADPGESGLWFGDMRFYYARSFLLPWRGHPSVPAKASGYLTLPTSRISQERGIVTRPTAIGTVAPSWGPFTLVGNVLFQYVFARWAQSPMGDPNPLLTTGFVVQAFYQVTEWFSPSVAWETYWNVAYQSRENEGQPIQPEYSFELALNFSVPMPEKAPSVDVSLAYAQGADVLEDGVSRLYFTKRDQSEMYLALNLTY